MMGVDLVSGVGLLLDDVWLVSITGGVSTIGIGLIDGDADLSLSRQGCGRETRMSSVQCAQRIAFSSPREVDCGLILCGLLLRPF